MTDAPVRDQYAVERLDDSGEWLVVGRFSDYGDALEYLNKECEKRFTTEPRKVMSADFEYRMREVNEVVLEIKFGFTPHGPYRLH